MAGDDRTVMPTRERMGRSRRQWLDTFDTLILALVDSDTTPNQAEAKIRNAAALADVALEEIERRWVA